MNEPRTDKLTTTKQSTTKPCAHFMRCTALHFDIDECPYILSVQLSPRISTMAVHKGSYTWSGQRHSLDCPLEPNWNAGKRPCQTQGEGQYQLWTIPQSPKCKCYFDENVITCRSQNCHFDNRLAAYYEKFINGAIVPFHWTASELIVQILWKYTYFKFEFKYLVRP